MAPAFSASTGRVMVRESIHDRQITMTRRRQNRMAKIARTRSVCSPIRVPVSNVSKAIFASRFCTGARISFTGIDTAKLQFMEGTGA